MLKYLKKMSNVLVIILLIKWLEINKMTSGPVTCGTEKSRDLYYILIFRYRYNSMCNYILCVIIIHWLSIYLFLHCSCSFKILKYNIREIFYLYENEHKP